MNAAEIRRRHAMPLLRKVSEVMLAMGADKHPVRIKDIEAQLVAGEYFSGGHAGIPSTLRSKVWNSERYFQSGENWGEYRLRQDAVALLKRPNGSPHPAWDRTQLLGEEVVQEKKPLGGLPPPPPDQTDFFGNATFMATREPEEPRYNMSWLPTADSRARLRIGLASALQRRGVAPKSCGLLFGTQATMFMNGLQRALPQVVFEVACLTLKVLPQTLLLANKSTEDVRKIAAAVDFDASSETPEARRAIATLRRAASRHRVKVLADAEAGVVTPSVPATVTAPAPSAVTPSVPAWLRGPFPTMKRPPPAPPLPLQDADKALFLEAAASGAIDELPKRVLTEAHAMLRDSHGNTAFHVAARHDNLGMIPDEIFTKASLLATNDEGQTACHLAAANGTLWQIPEQLLDREVLLAPDRRGSTPLHYATEACKLDNFPSGAMSEADLNVRDHKGMSPRRLASELNGFPQVERFVTRCRSAVPVPIPSYLDGHTNSLPEPSAVAQSSPREKAPANDSCSRCQSGISQ